LGKVQLYAIISSYYNYYNSKNKITTTGYTVMSIRNIAANKTFLYANAMQTVKIAHL